MAMDKSGKNWLLYCFPRSPELREFPNSNFRRHVRVQVNSNLRFWSKGLHNTFMFGGVLQNLAHIGHIWTYLDDEDHDDNDDDGRCERES